jgi:hypothetical protein
MRRVLPFLLLPWLASACSTSDAPSRTPVVAAQTLEFTTLVRGVHTPIRGERAVVLRDAEEWTELWREHASAQIPTAAAPTVDFGTQMVIGVVLGTCPTGGYGVEIVRVERTNSGLRAVAHRTTPPEGSAQTMVLSKPFHFVVVERSAAPVDFVWE